MAGKTFHCTAVTPEGKVLDTEAVSAIFPAYDGQKGVLPNHAPLVTKVGIGVLTVTTASCDLVFWSSSVASAANCCRVAGVSTPAKSLMYPCGLRPGVCA